MRSMIIDNFRTLLFLLLEDHHILLFLLIEGQLPQYIWFLYKDVAHVPGQLINFLSIMCENPFLLLLRTLHSLTVEVLVLINILQLFYLLNMIHHPVPITFLLLPLGFALALNTLRTFHMTQTVKLELHSYGKWFFYGFVALDFVALKGHDYFLYVQLEIRVEEVGMIVDPCQLLWTTPRILKDLDEDVSHQWLLQQLRMLPEVEPSQEIVIIPCLSDAQKVLVMQSCLVDCDQPISDHLALDFWQLHQFLKIQKVPSLARLVDPILFTAEPLTIVESERISCSFIQGHIEHEPDNGSSRPSLSMIAMHSHHPRSIFYITTILLSRYCLISCAIQTKVVMGGA